MSNDLISRKALLNAFDTVIAQYNWEDDGVIMDILTCVRDMVYDQPTAYDIDKIVERLEDEIEKKDDWLFSNAGIAYWNGGVRKAIKIVKGGAE